MAEENPTKAYEEIARKISEANEELGLKNKEIRQLESKVSEPSEIDARSIFVGNVDYMASPADLKEFFKECGTINRVTILLDKFTGQPKGFAYVEFTEPDSLDKAIALNEAVLKGRQLKVTAKRTNIPGLVQGRGRRGGGRRGYFYGRRPYPRFRPY